MGKNNRTKFLEATEKISVWFYLRSFFFFPQGRKICVFQVCYLAKLPHRYRKIYEVTVYLIYQNDTLCGHHNLQNMKHHHQNIRDFSNMLKNTDIAASICI